MINAKGWDQCLVEACVERLAGYEIAVLWVKLVQGFKFYNMHIFK